MVITFPAPEGFDVTIEMEKSEWITFPFYTTLLMKRDLWSFSLFKVNHNLCGKCTHISNILKTNQSEMMCVLWSVKGDLQREKCFSTAYYLCTDKKYLNTGLIVVVKMETFHCDLNYPLLFPLPDLIFARFQKGIERTKYFQ